MPTRSDKIKLANGIEVDLRTEQISLDGEGRIFYGYDGEWHLPGAFGFDGDETLSASDCVALANAMIARWQAVRAKYTGDQVV